MQQILILLKKHFYHAAEIFFKQTDAAEKVYCCGILERGYGGMSLKFYRICLLDGLIEVISAKSSVSLNNFLSYVGFLSHK